jgi:hypothetical protein
MQKNNIKTEKRKTLTKFTVHSKDLRIKRRKDDTQERNDVSKQKTTCRKTSKQVRKMMLKSSQTTARI